MDNSDSSSSSLYSLGGFGNLRPSQIQSPYANLPSLPGTISSDFILPEGSRPHRGRFELAFSQIGASVMTGAGIGGAIGTVKGIKEVSQLEAFLSVKRTQFLNYVTRNGASMANTFGTIALLYSTIGVGLSFVQEQNDDLNTLISAVSTGALYGAVSKSKLPSPSATNPRMLPMQLKRAAFGSAFGALAASCYILYFNKEKYFSK